MGWIYIIRNTVNTKVYIGQTKNHFQHRFRQHIYAANKDSQYIIYKAMRKYGIQNFFVGPLEQCNNEVLNEKEIFWIKFYKSNNSKYGYNMTEGGSKQGEPWNKSMVTSQQILKEFNNGLSAYNIAKKYHTEVARVTKILQQYNLKYGRELQKVANDVEQKVIQLYIKGYASTTIAKYFKLNKSTVLHILNRNNIKKRTTKETRLMAKCLPQLM